VKFRRGIDLPLVATGVVLLVLLSLFVGVFLAITDSALGVSARGTPRKYTAEAVEGRALYIREGCFTCHTQQVRSSFSDSAISRRVSLPGDYANEAPNLIGTERIGPDLTCIGDDKTLNADWHVRHLVDPSSERDHSNMPSYDFLTAGQLRALAVYLLSLTCGR
jgi:cbb3-type cytochrome c oxidase subunit II